MRDPQVRNSKKHPIQALCEEWIFNITEEYLPFHRALLLFVSLLDFLSKNVFILQPTLHLEAVPLFLVQSEVAAEVSASFCPSWAQTQSANILWFPSLVRVCVRTTYNLQTPWCKTWTWKNHCLKSKPACFSLWHIEQQICQHRCKMQISGGLHLSRWMWKLDAVRSFCRAPKLGLLFDLLATSAKLKAIKAVKLQSCKAMPPILSRCSDRRAGKRYGSRSAAKHFLENIFCDSMWFQVIKIVRSLWYIPIRCLADWIDFPSGKNIGCFVRTSSWKICIQVFDRQGMTGKPSETMHLKSFALHRHIELYNHIISYIYISYNTIFTMHLDQLWYACFRSLLILDLKLCEELQGWYFCPPSVRVQIVKFCSHLVDVCVTIPFEV